MKKLLVLLPLLAACGGGPEPLVGYMGSDVMEPEYMENPKAENVRLQGPLFQSGVLTWEGDGYVSEVFKEYMALLQKKGWFPANTQQEPGKGMKATLVKDIRTMELQVSEGVEDDVRVVVSVGPTKRE